MQSAQTLPMTLPVPMAAGSLDTYIQSVNRFPLLSAEQELAYARSYRYDGDLEAARAFGMRTAFVARPLEFGAGAQPDVAPEPWFDVYASSFVELADALGA